MDDKPWHLTTQPQLSVMDRLLLLFGRRRLFVRFYTPDGQCHAACRIEAAVMTSWPAQGEDAMRQRRRWRDPNGGWPPMTRPIPDPPGPPPPPPNMKIRRG